MVEVFKTNITCAEKAKNLLDQIHTTFDMYKANFDLHDCDNILRVVYGSAVKPSIDFTRWLYAKGCIAEALPDI